MAQAHFNQMDHYIGVDVGTGSARAALVSSAGKIIRNAVRSIKTFNPATHYYEQSSEDIWDAVQHVVQTVTNGIPKNVIKGIGFDATCSLVALDECGFPVSVSTTGNDEQNIILWMDHRAEAEANHINTLGHKLLRSVGGKISPEMEIPKILWLKRNLPKQWTRIKLLFDLPDFLTWKATNSESRSLCSLVCKWNYVASPDITNGWNVEFFDEIHLSDLKEDHWRRIGRVIESPGEAVGKGLSARAAEELGLEEGTPVGCSLIDAHAGALGMLGCTAPGISDDITSRLSLICGTSTCHMALSDKEIFVEGVWGPYYSAIVGGYWLNEGGQSATGKLLDHVIDTHPASTQIRNKISGKIHVQQYLSELLESMRRETDCPDVCYLTKDLHVWPDYHGNRSPLADPTLQGMISGLTLAADEENLAVLYLATMLALTYGTRHILEALTKSGHKIDTILICGGLSQNRLFVQSQADVLGLPVLIPNERESVLLGSAILGACAAGKFTTLQKAMRAMGGSGTVVKPNNISYRFHCRKYRVFEKMVADQMDYRRMMQETT